MLRIELIDDISDFGRLEPFWNPLLARSDMDIPFMTFEWLKMFLRINAGSRILVLVFRQDSDPVAVVPLMLGKSSWRSLPVTQLTFLANYYTPRTGLVDVSQQNVLDLAIRFLKARGVNPDLFYFDFVDSKSLTYRYIQDFIGRNGLKARVMAGELSPYFRMEKDWVSYLKTRSDNFREKVRRMDGFFGRSKDYRLACYREEIDVPRAIPQMLTVSRNTWKFKMGTAIANTAERTVFFTELARMAARLGWLKMLILSHREHPVAFTYELRYKGVNFFMKTGFDENYSRSSPGMFIVCRSVKEAFTDGFKEYDLLGKNEAYKMKFTPVVRHHAKFMVFNRTLTGGLLYILESMVIRTARGLLGKPKKDLDDSRLSEGEEARGIPVHLTGREKALAGRN